MAPALAGLREAQQLQRQHRKDAGHQVQQQPAEQGQAERGQQGRRGLGGRWHSAGVARGGDRRGPRPRPADVHAHLDARGRPGDQHRLHLRRALAALRRERHACRPGAAVPGLLDRRGGFDHAAGFREEDIRLALVSGRQPGRVDHQRLPFNPALCNGLRLRLRNTCQRRGELVLMLVHRCRARQREHELARLRNAHLLADQPVGTQLQRQGRH